MRKALRLTLLLCLAISPAHAEDMATPQESAPVPDNVQSAPPQITEQIKKNPVEPALSAPIVKKEEPPDLKDQTSILPPQKTVIEPKPITKRDVAAVFDAPIPVNIIQPEMPTYIQLSNRDINRIICPGPMTDLIFSEEKGITGHFSGNNAFVKFRAEDLNGELSYADAPSELFVVCNGAVYTLIAEPQEIPSVTINLSAPAKESYQKNIEHYKNMPLEKQVLQVIREAYEGIYPPSYKVMKNEVPMPMCGDLGVTQTLTLDVEGVGLRLMEYKATNTTGTKIEIREKDFLNMEISDSIIAVAIEDHILPSQGATRIFVVENREQVQ
jgi:conjugal transfer pilus assembly protein TraK